MKHFIRNFPLSENIKAGTPNDEIKCVFNADTTDEAVLSIKAAVVKNPVSLSRIVRAYFE